MLLSNKEAGITDKQNTNEPQRYCAEKANRCQRIRVRPAQFDLHAVLEKAKLIS